MDDLCHVETRLDALNGARITLVQRLLRAHTPLAQARIGLVYLAKGRPARVPRALQDALNALHGG